MTTFMSGEEIIQISQSFMALQLPHYSYLDPAQDCERAKQFYLNMFKKCSFFKSKMVAISMSSTVTTDFPRYVSLWQLVNDSSTIDYDKQIVICVVVHKTDVNHGDDQCTIQIQRVSSSPQWQRICKLALQIGTWLQNKSKSITPTCESSNRI